MVTPHMKAVTPIPTDTTSPDQQTPEKRRKRLSPAAKAKLLEELRTSGLSVRKFADQRGLSYQNLLRWRRKECKQNESRNHPLIGLVPVKVTPLNNASSDELEITLSPGIGIRLTSTAQAPLAAALIIQLQARRSC